MKNIIELLERSRDIFLKNWGAEYPYGKEECEKKFNKAIEQSRLLNEFVEAFAETQNLSPSTATHNKLNEAWQAYQQSKEGV